MKENYVSDFDFMDVFTFELDHWEGSVKVFSSHMYGLWSALQMIEFFWVLLVLKYKHEKWKKYLSISS